MDVEVSNSCAICQVPIILADLHWEGAGNIEPDSQTYEFPTKPKFPIRDSSVNEESTRSRYLTPIALGTPMLESSAKDL